MGEMLSSAADSSFPRHMKGQKDQNTASRMALLLFRRGHHLNLLCTGYKKHLFCEGEQEKMHTSPR